MDEQGKPVDVAIVCIVGLQDVCAQELGPLVLDFNYVRALFHDNWIEFRFVIVYT